MINAFAPVLLGLLAVNIGAVAATYCNSRPGDRCKEQNDCSPYSYGCARYCRIGSHDGFGFCSTYTGHSEDECTDSADGAMAQHYLADCVGSACGTFVHMGLTSTTGPTSNDTSPCN